MYLAFGYVIPFANTTAEVVHIDKRPAYHGKRHQEMNASRLLGPACQKQHRQNKQLSSQELAQVLENAPRRVLRFGFDDGRIPQAALHESRGADVAWKWPVEVSHLTVLHPHSQMTSMRVLRYTRGLLAE